jgi:hypothetical protein
VLPQVEVFERPEHPSLWQAAWRGEPTGWDALLGDYESVVDSDHSKPIESTGYVHPGCTVRPASTCSISAV